MALIGKRAKAKDSKHTTNGRNITKVALGSALLIVAAIGFAYPIWWNHRSSQGASQILHRDLSNIQKHSKSTLPTSSGAGSTCIATPGPGILTIPSLSLTAPVEQGLDNAVLDVAIGHDPATSWPGPKTAALFAAHDVSFFSHLNQLTPGDIIIYAVPCATYTFRVEGAQITSPGAPISVPNQGALVLDTCYPPNALWYTPDRYIVTASYVKTASQSPQSATIETTPPPLPSYSFVAPSAIPPQQLELSNNSQEMGQLTFTGDPSSAFQQSNDPLQVEAVGLKGWFALLHSLEADQPAWWKQIAPNIAFPQGFAGSNLSSTSPLEISENVTGSTPNSITLTGGENSHTFTLTATFNGSVMSIGQFSIQ
ncbi:MAG: class D sortase [Actinomycetota bacterium]|nr:class D sortase [Actinomycetota bacterium]